MALCLIVYWFVRHVFYPSNVLVWHLASCFWHSECCPARQYHRIASPFGYSKKALISWSRGGVWLKGILGVLMYSMVVGGVVWYDLVWRGYGGVWYGGLVVSLSNRGGANLLREAIRSLHYPPLSTAGRVALCYFAVLSLNSETRKRGPFLIKNS